METSREKAECIPFWVGKRASALVRPAPVHTYTRAVSEHARVRQLEVEIAICQPLVVIETGLVALVTRTITKEGGRGLGSLEPSEVLKYDIFLVRRVGKVRRAW